MGEKEELLDEINAGALLVRMFAADVQTSAMEHDDERVRLAVQELFSDAVDGPKSAEELFHLPMVASFNFTGLLMRIYRFRKAGHRITTQFVREAYRDSYETEFSGDS
jgi:hypothetical protein